MKDVHAHPIQNPFVKWPTLTIASGFGLGLAPIAPGTWGSLLGIPLGWYLLHFEIYFALALCALAFIPLSMICDRAGLHWGHRDSGKIVIDEVLGQAITLLGLYPAFYPNSEAAELSSLGWVVFIALGFVLFRLLDIVKPFPARSFDRKANGFGVMADDLVAGLYGAVILRVLVKIWLSSKVFS